MENRHMKIEMEFTVSAKERNSRYILYIYRERGEEYTYISDTTVRHFF